MDVDRPPTPRGALGIDPRGIQLFVAQITLLILVWIFVLLRILVKVVLIKRIHLDDWLMIAVVFIYTAHAVITVWGIVHASKEGEEHLARGESIALHSWFLCEVIYAPLSALIRTSIAVFLLRIAAIKLHRQVIYTIISIIWVLSIVYFFILLFQCTPISYFYKQPLGESGTCIDPSIVPCATIAHSIINAVMDFALALMPIVMLWDVLLNKRTKIGIAALLSMGFLAGIALMVRIPYVRFIPVFSTDFLNQANGIALWSLMETSLGIIAGCAATMRPLVTIWGFGVKSLRKESGDDLPPRPPSKAKRHNRMASQLEFELNLARELAGNRYTRYGDVDTDCASGDSGLSAVHIQTSIEVRRESQADMLSSTPSIMFPSAGDRVVTINGKGVELSSDEVL